MLIGAMLLRTVRRWTRRREGTAAVEFALAAPLLVAILLPMIDLGIAAYQDMEVHDAAQAGAQYALLNANATVPMPSAYSTAIQLAATNATTLSTISATPAPSTACGCSTGPAVVLSTDCTTPCANTLAPGHYVTVNTQATYTPVLPFSVFSNSTTLSASTTVRVQ